MGKKKNPSDENPFWVFGWIISELSITPCEVEFMSLVEMWDAHSRYKWKRISKALVKNQSDIAHREGRWF